MPDPKCPVCGCERFHVKNPQDAFDVYEFECRDGRPVFDADTDPGEAPEIRAETVAYCNRCAWHDRYDSLEPS